MEIYPWRQLLLFALSLLWGAMGVVLLWLLTALRTLVGAYVPTSEWAALYARPLPLLHRPPLGKVKRAGRVFSAVSVALCDAVFCVILAVGEILLLYEYNDGAMRPFALLCALVGLALAHRATARVANVATAYLGYGMAALRAYLAALLLLPCRGAVWIYKTLLLAPVRALSRRIAARRLQKTSAALCRAQLASAARGLAKKETEKEREGKNYGRQKKIARA